jgi:hypothetical protein
MSERFPYVTSANLVEPLSDLSHDLIDVVRLQKGWFLFQLRTPSPQDRILASFLLLVIAFISNLLDGRFPFFKTHRGFLSEYG